MTKKSNILATFFKRFHMIPQIVVGESFMSQHLIEDYAHILDEKLELADIVQHFKKLLSDQTDITYTDTRIDLMCILHGRACSECPFNAACDEYGDKMDKYPDSDIDIMADYAKALIRSFLLHFGEVDPNSEFGVLVGEPTIYTTKL